MIPSPEERAALLEELEAAQATAASLRAQVEAKFGQPRVVQTLRPGDPEPQPTVEQRREWALKQAMADGVLPVIRPGRERLADQVIVVDGEARVLRNKPAPRPMEVITPDNGQVMDYRWQWRRQVAENTALVQRYGLAQCLEAGFIHPHDRFLYEDVEQVTPPRGTEAL